MAKKSNVVVEGSAEHTRLDVLHEGIHACEHLKVLFEIAVTRKLTTEENNKIADHLVTVETAGNLDH